MTQEEKDIILKKIDSIYSKVVRGSWDYMEGRDDALSELRVFVNNMNITEYYDTNQFSNSPETPYR